MKPKKKNSFKKIVILKVVSAFQYFPFEYPIKISE